MSRPANHIVRVATEAALVPLYPVDQILKLVQLLWWAVVLDRKHSDHSVVGVDNKVPGEKQ